MDFVTIYFTGVVLFIWFMSMVIVLQESHKEAKRIFCDLSVWLRIIGIALLWPAVVVGLSVEFIKDFVITT